METSEFLTVGRREQFEQETTQVNPEEAFGKAIPLSDFMNMAMRKCEYHCSCQISRHDIDDTTQVIAHRVADHPVRVQQVAQTGIQYCSRWRWGPQL